MKESHLRPDKGIDFSLTKRWKRKEMVPCSLLQLKIAREEVFLEQQKSALSKTATGTRGAQNYCAHNFFFSSLVKASKGPRKNNLSLGF